MASDRNSTDRISRVNGPQRTTDEPVIDVRNMSVQFTAGDQPLHAVIDVSLHVRSGERVGLIGESGSGKSVTAKAMMGLLDPHTSMVGSESIVLYEGKNILASTEREWHALRGNAISMIFQNPMHALNPSFRIGVQIERVIRAHRPISKRAGRLLAVDALRQVDLPGPEELMFRYPHQLSGGMKQRVLVAMAVACEPNLVIADEPTSALDVTAQDTVLSLLQRLSEELGIAILIITHDMGVVARFCEVVNVMYGGRIVEAGPVRSIFARPRHPYTAGLLAATPNPATSSRKLMAIPGTQEPRTDGLALTACTFLSRCQYAEEKCRTIPPPVDLGHGHSVSCHLVERLDFNPSK